MNDYIYYIILFISIIIGVIGLKKKKDDSEAMEPNESIIESKGYKKITEKFIMEYIKNINVGIDIEKREKIASNIIKYSKRYDVNPYYILSIIHRESTFNPESEGSSGEIGLMQIMPIALESVNKFYPGELREVNKLWLYNIAYNIKVGILYFKICRKKANSLREALYIYNEWVDYGRIGKKYGRTVESILYGILEFKKERRI